MSGKRRAAQAVDTTMNVTGNSAGVAGTGLDIASELGSAGNAAKIASKGAAGLGAFTGAYGMGKAGGDMYKNGVGLQNSTDMAFNGLGTFAGVSGLLGSTGPAAPVAGAAAMGYGVGGLINEAGNSEYAKQAPGSVGGTNETYADWWLDQGVAQGGVTGAAIATVGGTFGTIADAGVAAWNYLFD